MAPSQRLRFAVSIVLGLSGWIAGYSNARGQLSPDPYKPFNSQYEQYVFPSYPTGDGVSPNQSLLDARPSYRSANQYRSFLDEMDEAANGPVGSSSSTIRRGIGTPYYQAHRDYNRSHGRVYTPNGTADQDYLANRQARDDAWSDYQRFKGRDPKAAAKALKEYELYNEKTRRDLSANRTEPARRPAANPSRETSRDSAPPRPRLDSVPSRTGTRARSTRPPIPGTESATGRSATQRGSSGSSPTSVLNRNERESRESVPQRRRPPIPSSPPERPKSNVVR